jgi:hypothetical protein
VDATIYVRAKLTKFALIRGKSKEGKRIERH